VTAGGIDRPFEPIAMDVGGAGDGRERALALLLLSMADDEFVIGFSDSEWTGIGPILEEDVAISSLAQDELGHAQALYGLLADTVADGRDADAWAYDRPPEGYLHARLLDHHRGDWAATIVRRYLYDTADSARLEAVAGSSHRPLAELVAKIRREERYHLMHVQTWIERLADAGGESRARLLAALATMGPDAGTVLAPLPGETALVRHGIVTEPFAAIEGRWRDGVGTTFRRLGLPELPPTATPDRARTDHSDAFRALHADFTSVRRSEAGATW
jgi:ring-1,2-phenylacetyl-CoA epoxidase subunit PaaC